MASTTIDTKRLQFLNSAEQTELLNVVDELRAEGLSDFTSLPQLIVCGDQSSGKSSVLQAISGLVFPSKDNLCTRFATEVILRRVATKGLSVSIMPGQDRSAVDRERLLDFRYAIQNAEDFAALFGKAKEVMGLTDHSSAFSKDILRVEISGPSQPQLTLVDLPGLIHSESKSLTTQDLELVTELVKSYMKNPRSIILAVITAKNDFSNQIVLKRARELDPKGFRTLGIITKPDTLNQGSVSETSFLSLARNEEFEFTHGWHVVKNQDTAKGEFNPANRDSEEDEWFADSNFKALPSASRGVSRLRDRLSKMLFNQIREQLPGLMADIEKEKTECRAKLEELGQSRLTLEEQREHLLEISEGFERLCTDAINGPYNDPFFGDGVAAEGYEKRLRAVVRNMQIQFADTIRTDGEQWKIVEDPPSEDKRCRTRAQAVEKVLSLVKRSRCKELPGLPNPMLVAEVFREYSKPWNELARQHISKVWYATRVLLERVVEHLTEPDLGDLLFRFLLDPLMDEFLRNAQTKLAELNAVRDKAPITTNHYFRDTVTKLRRDRDVANMTPKLKRLFDEYSEQGGVDSTKIPDIILMAYPKVQPDMDRVAAEDIFDYMSAFYKVAMKLFIDNIPTLVTEVMLLAPISRMFCPKVVYKMKPEMIAQIASESEEKKWKREELSRKLERLDSGWGICRRHVARMKAVGASATLGSGNPKSSDSKFSALTNHEIAKPEVPVDDEVANLEEEEEGDEGEEEEEEYGEGEGVEEEEEYGEGEGVEEEEVNFLPVVKPAIFRKRAIK